MGFLLEPGILSCLSAGVITILGVLHSATEAFLSLSVGIVEPGILA